MELIRNAAENALLAAELPVVPPQPDAPIGRVRTSQVTVQIRRCAMDGKYRYLGTYETETAPLELYAHQAKAEVLATAHTPADDGGTGCAALAAQVADCWLGGVTGLSMQCVTIAAPEYNAALDCFVCTVCAEVSAWVYALPVDDGAYFEDFALKGTLLAWNGQEDNR